jgi:ParB family transcriptional regulator, chromosome partitioning protein
LTGTPQARGIRKPPRATDAQKKGGKGENEMLQATVETATQVQPVPVLNDFRELPIYALQESPTNPRRSFDEAKLFELAQSIRSQGVLVPLIVRELDVDRFEVVAGARRFRAARLAELDSVPVRVVQLTDTQVLEYQLIENAIREDVHPYEEAMAYKALLDTSEPRYDVASIAAKTGRSITHVYQRLRLAELIPDAAEVFQANQITARCSRRDLPRGLAHEGQAPDPRTRAGAVDS